MFYDPVKETSGLTFNPFKSCCVPRPIGWLSTVSGQGIHNIAPYSQFQNVTWDQPTVMVAINYRVDGSLKDTAANILENGEFVWNMATYGQRGWVVGSSLEFAPADDEFEKVGIAWEESRFVKPRRVKGSPVQFECKLMDKLAVPGLTPESGALILVARVIGIHIADDALMSDGCLDITRLQPLARMGYRDYTCVDKVFQLSEFDGRTIHDSAHNFETQKAA